jgi:hypothetical protein
MQECKLNHLNINAVEYCGTRPSGGICQLEILKNEGMKYDSFLLEIGCGPLMMGIPAMSYLDKNHYYGLEPNDWIVKQTLSIPENNYIYSLKNPVISNNDNFDASSFGIKFDFIYAHSIMSHASMYQLPLFLENSYNVIKLGGKLIFSLRLTTSNKYGNEGSDKETNSENWIYPGCSFFHQETVEKIALKFFKNVKLVPEYTELLTNNCKGVCHDWFVCTKL